MSKNQDKDIDDLLNDINGTGPSKNASKKQKQKAKKAATEGETTGSADVSSPKPEAKKPEPKKPEPKKPEPKKPEPKKEEAPKADANKPAPKVSAARKAMIERIQKAKEEEERIRREEEEEQRKFDEEQARLAEERLIAEKKREEEIEQRRIERERLRKEGKLLSAKQKEKEEARRRYVEQLKAQGVDIPGFVEQDDKTPSDTKGSTTKKPIKKAVQKTKAQLETERILAEKQRIEEEREQIRLASIEALRQNKPELVQAFEEANAALSASLEEHQSLKTEIEALEKQKAEADAAKADAPEEDLDDWDVSGDEGDDAEDAYLVCIGRLTTARSRFEELDTQLPTLRLTATAAEQAMESDRSATEQVLIKEADETKKRADAEEAERKRKEAESLEKQNTHRGDSNLRSPIIVILGHVDSGKTSLLDKIRNSSVAKGEAGGITQQIGATFIPIDAIKEMTRKLPEEKRDNAVSQLPGLLVIDTPGHESFSKLRSRGSSLCDIAILVVDIQKGLQQQTLESIELLRMRKTPFVVAVTKVDALYGWDKSENNTYNPIKTSLDNASDSVQFEYEKLMRHTVAEFAKQNLNALPFYENNDPNRYVSLIPVSSKTGEGIPDLVSMVCELTQVKMKARLAHRDESLQCTVLEVTNLQGYGATLDVILVNGSIRDTDTIVCSSLSGPIVASVRALLTPPPLKEMRNKMDYVQNKVVHAAMGLKISAPGLSTVLPGSNLMVCGPRDDLEDLKDQVQEDLQSVICRLDTNANGVFVHASSLGSLEALLTFLKENNIPVAGFDIGPVHKVSVTKASVAHEKKRPEYAVLLAFDVKVETDATVMADKLDVQIFQADVIYQLTNRCLKYFEEIKNQAKANAKPVFPVVIRPLGKDFVFHNTDPIVMGVRVIAGSLRVGTPLYIPTLEGLQLGRVSTIKKDNKDVQIAHKTDEVSIGIEQKHLEHPPVFGRQFDETSDIFSHMTRASIQQLTEFYEDELSETDHKLIDKFVELFRI